MAAPNITITKITRLKIGWQSGVNQSVVKFKADQVLKDFEARAEGIGRGTGLLVGSSGVLYPSDALVCSNSLVLRGYALPAGTEQQFEVDRDELQQDGQYRINIYGMNEVGEWTPYE